MKKNNKFYLILRFILKPLFIFWYNPIIINKEVIPKNGSFIICGNHRHFMDQFPVIISTNRVIHWLSKKEYFDGPFSFFFKYSGCICVDRKAHDGKAIKKAINYLKKGECIGLFPEGTRNKTNKELLSFKTGAIKIAKETNVPIIPFAITGDFKFRSKNLVVRFGNIININKDSDTLLETERLKNTILSLTKKDKS